MQQTRYTMLKKSMNLLLTLFFFGSFAHEDNPINLLQLDIVSALMEGFWKHSKYLSRVYYAAFDFVGNQEASVQPSQIISV